MNEARLIVEPSSISLRASGPATGDIALAIGGTIYPVVGWNDFVLVILEAWLGALVRIVRHTSDAERVHFMEGPYAIDLARLSSGVIQLRAFERPNRQRAVINVMPKELVENATSAANDVIVFCRERGYSSPDLDRLESLLAALRQEEHKLTTDAARHGCQ